MTHHETSQSSMSLVVLTILARPGAGTGGAEASPPRVSARGAALEHACRRHHGATPGTDSEPEHICGGAPMLLHAEHQRHGQLSCDGRRKGKAPARGVPADVMRVRQGSGVAQASGPNPMSFPGVNSC